MSLVAPLNSSTALPCTCGRTFLQHSALTNHQRTCSRTKKRLATALLVAQEQFEAKKRRRLEARAPASASHFGVELRPPSAHAESERGQPDIEAEKGPETPIPESDAVRHT
jgi:hypothetical protein